MIRATFAVFVFLAPAAHGQFVAQSLHLQNAVTTRDQQEFMSVLRTVLQFRDVAFDSGRESIVISGSAEQVHAAEFLVQMLDKPKGWHPSEQELANPGDRQVTLDSNTVRVVYLKNSVIPMDVQQILTVLRSVGEVRLVFPFTSANALIYSVPLSQVEMAEWMIRALDVPADGSEYPKRSADSSRNLYRLAEPRRDGSPDVVQVFYLPPAATQKTLNDLLTAVRTKKYVMKAFTHTDARALVARGSPASLDNVANEVAEAEK